MTDQITYEGFFNLIESMVQRKESGTLYVRTDTNHSLVVGIRNGTIEAFTSCHVRKRAQGPLRVIGERPPSHKPIIKIKNTGVIGKYS